MKTKTDQDVMPEPTTQEGFQKLIQAKLREVYVGPGFKDFICHPDGLGSNDEPPPKLGLLGSKKTLTIVIILPATPRFQIRAITRVSTTQEGYWHGAPPRYYRTLHQDQEQKVQTPITKPHFQQ